MNKNDLGALMQQAQQLKDNMQKMQQEMALLEVEGQSGAGLIKITMTYQHEAKRVTLDPSLLNEDKEMLEDLIAAAINDAVRRVQVKSKEKMGSLAQGVGLPAGMNLPF